MKKCIHLSTLKLKIGFFLIVHGKIYLKQSHNLLCLNSGSNLKGMPVFNWECETKIKKFFCSNHLIVGTSMLIHRVLEDFPHVLGSLHFLTKIIWERKKVDELSLFIYLFTVFWWHWGLTGSVSYFLGRHYTMWATWPATYLFFF